MFHMEECIKEAVAPIKDEVDDAMDVHDLLNQYPSTPIGVVKEEPYPGDSTDDLPEFKDVLPEVVGPTKVNFEATTPKPSCFCGFCRLDMPNTASQLIILPPKSRDQNRFQRNTELQQLLKCGNYSSLTVKESLTGDGTIVMCHRYGEERNPAAHFVYPSTLQNVPVTSELSASANTTAKRPIPYTFHGKHLESNAEMDCRQSELRTTECETPLHEQPPTFFCALCRSHISTAVSQHTIPSKYLDPENYHRNTVLQQLLKCGIYSSSVVEEMTNDDGTTVICLRHMEERNPEAHFFCAICRQHIPITEPNLVVTANPVSKQVVYKQLLRKHSKWKVEDSLEGPGAKFICRHHLDVYVKLTKTLCSLCGNTEIILGHTTVIPSNPDKQMQLRERIIEAQVYPERVDQMFALAQRQEKGAEPLRLCEDHLKNEEREQFEGWRVVDEERECGAIDSRRASEIAEEKRKRKNERERELYRRKKERKLEQKKKEDEQMLREEHEPVSNVNSRRPKKPLTKEQKAKSKTQRLQLQKQMAEESEAQAAERRREAREKWHKRKENDPEKWAEWCRKRNERRMLSRQQERKQRDEERQRRMEREKTGESSGENEENEGSGETTESIRRRKKVNTTGSEAEETTNEGWKVRMERFR